MKLGFGHPTGDRTAASDMDGNLLVGKFGEEFADWRPSHRNRGLGDGIAHQDNGIPTSVTSASWPASIAPWAWISGAIPSIHARKSALGDYDA